MMIIKKIFFLIDKKNLLKFFILNFYILIGALLEVLSIGIIIPLISLLFDNNFYIKLNNLFSERGITLPEEQNFLIIFVLIIIIIFFIKAFYMMFLIFCRTSFVKDVANNISLSLFSSYLNRPYTFHINNNSSKLILNCKNEVDIFSYDVMMATTEIITETIIIFFLFLFLIFFEPIGTLIVTITCFFFIYLYFLYTHKKTLFWGIIRKKNDIELIKKIQNGISGIREVIIFSKQKIFINNFFKNLNLSNTAQRSQTFYREAAKYFTEFMAILGILFLIYYLHFSYSKIEILTKLSVFGAVFFKTLPALNRVISARQRITFSNSVINSLYDEMYHYVKNKKYFNNSQEIKKISFNEKILIKDLSFYYNKKNVLSDVNITINKGDKVGIVGESGSGKTTFINIFVGLLKPNNGYIEVDGFKVNDRPLEWMNLISYIPQNFYILDDDLRSNIVFENNYKIKDNDKKIIECLYKSQLEDFYNKLPNGLDTVVGEGGSKISQGQAQRLSIARALYKNPEILVLDEATSALDTHNENNFLDLLDNIMKNKTYLFVSHNMSALSKCNKILKIEKNKIIELN